MATQNKPVVTPEDFEALQLANIALEGKVMQLNAALEGAKAQLKDRENAVEAHRSTIETLQEASAESQSRAVPTERPVLSPAIDPSDWQLTQRICWNGKSIGTPDLTPDIVASLLATETPLLKPK
jgi:hypothetical protein